MALQIRATCYRGRKGFSVSGSSNGSSVRTRIFVHRRATAEKVREAVKRHDNDAITKLIIAEKPANGRC